MTAVSRRRLSKQDDQRRKPQRERDVDGDAERKRMKQRRGIRDGRHEEDPRAEQTRP